VLKVELTSADLSKKWRECFTEVQPLGRATTEK